MSQYDGLPSESEEQKAIAKYLNFKNVFWFHPANEGKRSWAKGRSMKAEGLLPGVPDIIILQSIPKYPNSRGAMIEMKRRKGGRISPEQQAFLSIASDHGWLTHVAYGADDALQFLQSIGF